MPLLYLLKGWNGLSYLMSAKKIHKKVMDQCEKSNYDWIASATDLVLVCESKKFPKTYAIDIKIAILNCFSELRNDENRGGRKESDLNAVEYAFNSLYEIQDEKAIKARINFLYSFLLSIAHCQEPLNEYIIRGDLYYEYRQKWCDKKVKTLILEKDIDFYCLSQKLKKEFRDAVEFADRDGVFFEDDQNHQRNLIICM